MMSEFLWNGTLYRCFILTLFNLRTLSIVAKLTLLIFLNVPWSAITAACFHAVCLHCLPWPPVQQEFHLKLGLYFLLLLWLLHHACMLPWAPLPWPLTLLLCLWPLRCMFANSKTEVPSFIDGWGLIWRVGQSFTQVHLRFLIMQVLKKQMKKC